MTSRAVVAVYTNKEVLGSHTTSVVLYVIRDDVEEERLAGLLLGWSCYL